jgi:hypothetical protein
MSIDTRVVELEARVKVVENVLRQRAAVQSKTPAPVTGTQSGSKGDSALLDIVRAKLRQNGRYFSAECAMLNLRSGNFDHEIIAIFGRPIKQ